MVRIQGIALIFICCAASAYDDVWILTPDPEDSVALTCMDKNKDIENGFDILSSSMIFSAGFLLHFPHNNFGGSSFKERFAITSALVSSSQLTEAVRQEADRLVICTFEPNAQSMPYFSNSVTAGLTGVLLFVSYLAYSSDLDLSKQRPQDLISSCAGNAMLAVGSRLAIDLFPVKDTSQATALALLSVNGGLTMVLYRFGCQVKFDAYGDRLMPLVIGHFVGGMRKPSQFILSKLLQVAGLSQPASRVGGAGGTALGFIGGAVYMRSVVGNKGDTRIYGVQNMFIVYFVKGSGAAAAADIPEALYQAYGRECSEFIDGVWEDSGLPTLLPESMENIHWPIVSLSAKLGTGCLAMAAYNSGTKSELLDGTSFGIFLGALGSLGSDIKKIPVNIYKMSWSEHAQMMGVFTALKLLPSLVALIHWQLTGARQKLD